MAQTIKLKRSSTSGRIPTTSDLALGEVAINTYDGKMYIKKNVGGTESIVEIGASGGGLASSFTLYEYTATASQTTFSGSDSNSNTLAYDTGTPPKILVYLNGVLLDHTTDYTATNGTSVVLTSAAAASDLVQIAAYKSTVTSDQDIDLDDNQKILLGDDDDLQIYHDGSTNNSIIKETGSGNLELWGNNVKIMNVAGTETQLNANPNGQVELYYDNSKKLETTSSGIQVQGAMASTTGAYSPIYYGGSSSLQLKSNTGELFGQFTNNGAAELYYDNTKKFETTNDGVTVTGDVEADEFIGDVRGAVLFKAQAGETLAKGDVVYISGISGNTTIVSKADADDASKMPAFGLVAAAASSGNPVDIYTNGILSGIDTSSYSEGDELFVSTTAGALTATAPTGESAALQKIGKVTRSASSGSIFIVGAGRTNAVPNLNEGKLFVGNSSNQAVADDTVHVDIANSVVGINKTSPSSAAALHVDGHIYVDTGDAIYADFFRPYSTTLATYGSSTNTDHYFLGSVGIGTNSPDSRLHINTGSGTGDANTVIVDRAGSTDYSGVSFATAGTVDWSIGQNSAGNFEVFEDGLDSKTRLTIKTGGNVGIGSASPSEKLTVNGNIYAISGEINVSAYKLNGTYIVDSSRNLVNIGTVTASGIVNIGGGTSYFSEKLLVQGRTRVAGQLDISAGTGYGNYAKFTHDDTELEIATVRSAGTNGQIVLSPLGNAALTLDTSGNVGIGDTSPDYKLHVNSGATNVVAKFESTDSTAAIQFLDNNGNVEIGATGSKFTVNPAGGVPVIEASATDIIFNNNGDDVNFRVESDTSPNAFSIDGATGNIGMGTATPDEFGIGSTYKYLAVGGDKPGIINLVDSSTSGSYLQFGTAAGVRRASIHAENGSHLSFTLNASNSGTSLTERMRIERTGDWMVGNSVSRVASQYNNQAGIGWRESDHHFEVATTYNRSAAEFGRNNANSGDVITIRQQGNSIGMIGTEGGDSLVIQSNGSTGTGIRFHPSRAAVEPVRAGVTIDDTISLGADTRRFKDLHLSNAANIGHASIETSNTSTTATTQVAIDTFAAATFRSARYTIQVTNSTDSTYHLTEILLIHDGTTPQITEYGTIFTGSAEATFDADISSGNVRLLATPATTDSMTFKVVRHCITV